MLQQTDFFQVKELTKEENKFSAQISLNKEHEIFQGHFPGQPVTPGVCMLDIIKELCEQEYQKEVAVSAIKTIKFLSILDPQLQSEVVADVTVLKQENDTMEVKAELKDQEKAYFKFRGTFTDFE
ncbi:MULTISPECIES: hypothetical protein [Flammeovirga]|uniref:3-hydroxyacyl-ACP dehydratase n=1 Tax=Flammeovirga aprica JL-4 TaxID=694437 RepID=A0A7X9P0Q2_9BACT|nr:MULTISPECIES: hypothetical protein [Flammeovirga]KXX71686.1 hypothetical protein AVL50_05280 [Flammeovirga sp. SJP92]NME66509.1 3-hydroxyacyl-ACP dehydratase [Flammeovirga aprica JL-4]